MSWQCTCGVTNKDKYNECAGCGWTREQSFEYYCKTRRINPKEEYVDDRCPRCGSNKINSNKQGFGLGKAAGGKLIFGPIGLLLGLVGSRKTNSKCMICNYKWDT